MYFLYYEDENHYKSYDGKMTLILFGRCLILEILEVLILAFRYNSCWHSKLETSSNEIFEVKRNDGPNSKLQLRS